MKAKIFALGVNNTWTLTDLPPENIQLDVVNRRFIGRLIYLIITRLVISYVVNTLSPFLDKPSKHHFDATTCVLKYIKLNP